MIKLSTAYLVVQCDSSNNNIKNVKIVSSPPWLQNIRTGNNVSYVAMIMQGESFRKAFESMINYVKSMKVCDSYHQKIYNHLKMNTEL